MANTINFDARTLTVTETTGDTLRVQRTNGRAWTENDSLTVDVRHDGDIALPVQIAFGTGENEDKVAVTATFGVLPGVKTRLVFPLTALNAETVFLPRTPGRLKCTLFGTPTKPDDVTWFSVSVGQTGVAVTVELTDLQLTDAPEKLVPVGPILVDELGQWTTRDWPGKMHSAAELVADLQARRDAPPVEFPPNRTRYGGSKEITFDATGWFRTHHDGERWWLVDPDGGAFWSAGADCVGFDAFARVTGNENLCAWLPPRDGEFGDCWHGPDMFSWMSANLRRAFGDGWQEPWAKITTDALRGMGFNTVGNWSNAVYARHFSGLPYVFPLADFPTTHSTVFRDFPDVFAPEYAANAARFAEQLRDFADDKNLIGYFLRNEPLWGFGVFRVAEELLTHDPARAPFCRRALARYLHEMGSDLDNWRGVIEKWEDLETLWLEDASKLTDEARADLTAFSRKMVDAYVRIPSEACRKIDANHLNLGMRWAWIASDDLLAGADACDVFSLNFYNFAPDKATVEKASKASGKPVMIGEFHFGATDRGLPSNGLRGVATQTDRGKAYRYFVEQSAAMPEVIGAHYFQWNDQPLLGRFDGENWQIGIVDACHRPYPEFAEAARQTHETLHDVASGKQPPLAAPPPEVPKLGY